MKKLLYIGLSILFISCGYYKEKEVRASEKSETYFCIWIYKNGRIIDGLFIPIEKANKKSIDSLNTVADKYIKKLNEIDK